MHLNIFEVIHDIAVDVFWLTVKTVAVLGAITLVVGATVYVQLDGLG